MFYMYFDSDFIVIICSSNGLLPDSTKPLIVVVIVVQAINSTESAHVTNHYNAIENYPLK